MNRDIKVLLIEDDTRISEIVSKGLTKKGYDVTPILNGRDGLTMAKHGAFDIIILDVNLPFLNGNDVCLLIREKDSHIPILMLTAMSETADLVRGFENGADDYLTKPFDFRELEVRIASLLRRRNVKPTERQSNSLVFHDLTLDLDKKSAVRAGKTIDLTAKEFLLLEYLIRNNGRVISKSELSESVWALNFDTGTNIVEVYINYLRKKIDKDFDQKLIHTKPGLGYFLAEK